LNTRPFRILGIQQVAIGGLDKGKLRRLWVDTLGIPVTGHFRSERENVDEDILTIGAGTHAVEVDLMQPIDPHKKPAVHAWLQAQGVRFAPGGIRKGAAGHDICFIHPRGDDASPIGGEGVLIELVQAPPEVIAHITSR
jgi:lactoylglutathione lyase